MTVLTLRNTMYYKGGVAMGISLRVNAEEETLIRAYAGIRGTTISEVVREAILEKIECEYDLKVFEEAYAEYLTDPVTYTLDEVVAELGL